MNRILKTTSMVIAVLLLYAGNVFAWSVDITPVYGDQDATDIIADVGDTVMYQLWFNPDSEGTTIETAYVWRLNYDESELEFDLANSTQYDMGQPFQWSMSPLKEDPSGYTTAGAMTFSDGTTLDEPMLLADLAYIVINPVNDDLSDLFYVSNPIVPGGDGFYITGEEGQEWHDGLDIVANHNLTNGADVAPVPIPGAIFLLVPALLGLIGLRRKKA